MFEHVMDNIYIVSASGSGTFPSSYSFYIDDEVKTIIDTPLDPSFINLFTKRPLDLIVNTHFHRDHSGCNHLFPEAKVYVHPLDAPPMQSSEIFTQFYGLDAPENSKFRQGLLEWLNYKPSHVSKHIEDGEIIDLGKTKLEVIHTPGHTPGHCVLYNHENGVLFSGDIDMTGFGPWYGNAVSNVDDVIESIEKLIALRPKVILSGHKGIIDTNVVGQLKKYLDKVFINEEKILTTLTRPLTLSELVEHKIIYGRWGEPQYLFAFFEKVSLERHLERLMRLGLVTFNNGYYESKTSISRKTSCK